jgi:hypothetical protein
MTRIRGENLVGLSPESIDNVLLNVPQYPLDTPACQQFCGQQTLPTTAAYLPNNPWPISV